MDGEFVSFDDFDQDSRFPHKSAATVLEDTGGSFLLSIQAGTGIVVDDADPRNPIVSSPLYVLPQATDLVLGGIKLGAKLVFDVETGLVDVTDTITETEATTLIDDAISTNNPTALAAAESAVAASLADDEDLNLGAGMVAYNDELVYPVGSVGAQFQGAPSAVAEQIANALDTLLQTIIYPIGSIYSSATSAVNPNTILGFGEWTAIAGRVLVGLDAAQPEFDALLETGGSKTHTLSIAEMPVHIHKLGYESLQLRSPSDYNRGGYTTSSTDFDGAAETQEEGGGDAHNNLQPYTVVAMWRRTA